MYPAPPQFPTTSTTPKLSAFYALLREYGPHTHFKRRRLRDALLAAAQRCREDAEHLRQRTSTFRAATGLPLTLLGTSKSGALPTTPQGWEAQAAEYELMADHVFDEPGGKPS